MRHEFWKNHGKKKVLIIAGVICLAAIAAFQLVHKGSTATKPNNTKLQNTVDVLTVAKTGLTKRISLTGQTVPVSQVDIAAKYQGKVTAVNVVLGQPVSAGQVLIVQDTGDAELAVAQNQAAYRQASADAITSEVTFNSNYDKAKADYYKALTSYQRYKSLFDIGAISHEQLDTNEQQLADAKAIMDSLANQATVGSAPSAVESARAAATRAQNTVRAAEKQLSDLMLVAPQAGVIGYRQVEVGSMVQPGQKLLSVVDNSKIYVDCQVSEQDIPSLAIGMNVNVQIESLGRTFDGQIIFISPANDPSNQSFSIRIALTNPDASVRSGMFARVVINSVIRPDALTVPKDAVLEKNGKYYVYVVNAQNAVEDRVVQIGAKGDQNIEILSGLNAGEQVAVSNLARLKTGMVITPNAVVRGENQ
jgi:RND family efflux transporter MFP subunit